MYRRQEKQINYGQCKTEPPRILAREDLAALYNKLFGEPRMLAGFGVITERT
jgi:hypothetical protein